MKNKTNVKIPISLLVGKKYGRWTILNEAKPYVYPSGERRRQMKVKCECGNFNEIDLNSLRSGNSKSCGCYHVDQITKHGLFGHRLYSVWHGMKDRCYNKNRREFPFYGGRGIRICNEWKTDFVPFYKWATTHGYTDSLVIDRIDVNGNYEPENCRFVSRKLSSCNQRLLSKTNTSGYRGVSWNMAEKKYVAGISVDNKRRYLGSYGNPKEAASAYDACAKSLNDGRPLNFASGSP